ncbi:MAG: hypothetical protein MJZ24_05765 [Paludibacteraceae bacterium]|nr:hypothetical protein [Paludibacteraceae bacterium]
MLKIQLVSAFLILGLGTLAYIFFSKESDVSAASKQVVCGGSVTKQDPKAPKIIKSKDLDFFDADFCISKRYGTFGYDFYHFIVSFNDEGKLILLEKNTNTSCEADTSIFRKIQQVIDECNLVEHNGYYHHTAGLPPEYDTSSLTAKYASGEKLHFCYDVGPDSRYALELLNIFFDEYEKKDVTALLPPPDSKVVKQFKFRFAEDDNVVECAQIVVHDEETDKEFLNVYIQIWNRKENREVEEKFGLATEDFFKGLQQLVKSEKLFRFDNLNAGLSDESSKTPCFYEFYIDYKYGNRLSGFSRKKEDFDKFKVVLDKFVEYVRQTATSDEYVLK